MAIKGKDSKGSIEVPESYKTPFLIDAASKCLSKIRKTYSDPMKLNLTESSEFELTVGETTECQFGKILYKVTQKQVLDNDKILELVEAGRINLASLINLGDFDANGLKSILSETEFSGIVKEVKKIPALTLTASEEVEAEAVAMIDSALQVPCDIETTTVTVKKTKVVATETKVEKTKAKVAPKAKAKTKKSRDLNDILGE